MVNIFSLQTTKTALKFFLSVLSSANDFYTSSYDNILVIADFNTKPKNPVLESFMKNLHNHVKHKLVGNHQMVLVSALFNPT